MEYGQVGIWRCFLFQQLHCTGLVELGLFKYSIHHIPCNTQYSGVILFPTIKYIYSTTPHIIATKYSEPVHDLYKIGCHLKDDYNGKCCNTPKHILLNSIGLTVGKQTRLVSLTNGTNANK